jgi:hypothetical protein
MAPKGKALAATKLPPVITRSACSICGTLMMSNEIVNRLAYTYSGFKISKQWLLAHKRCLSGKI